MLSFELVYNQMIQASVSAQKMHLREPECLNKKSEVNTFITLFRTYAPGGDILCRYRLDFRE